jgi:hypothetical protein
VTGTALRNTNKKHLPFNGHNYYLLASIRLDRGRRYGQGFADQYGVIRGLVRGWGGYEHPAQRIVDMIGRH